jgi:catechol 2,3-dioxygenase-like lactoylglutathione lyase family enzyme
MKTKTTNTILYCRKWEKTVAFYKTLLNRPIKTSKDWFVEFKLNETSCLSIADAARASIDSSHGAGITITLEVDDIEITHAYLTELALDPSPIKDHIWGARVVHVFDPEGHRVEFWAQSIR